MFSFCGADPLVRGRRPRRPAPDRSGSWGTRADQGVRPTHADYLPTHKHSYPAGQFPFSFFQIQ